MQTDFDIAIEPIHLANMSPEQYLNVAAFIAREAQLLDSRQFDQWLDLWTRGGMYWVPAATEQADPYAHVSLFWENATLRALRVKRLLDPNAWSQQPPTRTVRSVANVHVEGIDAQERLVVSAVFHLVESRTRVRRLDGKYTYRLVQEEDGLKIDFKRVDLVNVDQGQELFEVFI